MVYIARKHTENSHIKTNLVHTLYRVQKYGLMEVDKFQELLSANEVKACQQQACKIWYKMPLEVFTSFIFQVRFKFIMPVSDLQVNYLNLIV